jgi:hypothetical protein
MNDDVLKAFAKTVDLADEAFDAAVSGDPAKATELNAKSRAEFSNLLDMMGLLKSEEEDA